jgi:hypothetical protein
MMFGFLLPGLKPMDNQQIRNPSFASPVTSETEYGMLSGSILVMQRTSRSKGGGTAWIPNSTGFWNEATLECGGHRRFGFGAHAWDAGKSQRFSNEMVAPRLLPVRHCFRIRP